MCCCRCHIRRPSCHYTNQILRFKLSQASIELNTQLIIVEFQALLVEFSCPHLHLVSQTLSQPQLRFSFMLSSTTQQRPRWSWSSDAHPVTCYFAACSHEPCSQDAMLQCKVLKRGNSVTVGGGMSFLIQKVWIKSSWQKNNPDAKCGDNSFSIKELLISSRVSVYLNFVQQVVLNLTIPACNPGLLYLA